MATSGRAVADRDLTEKGRSVRQAILTAATDLFAAKGLAGTSISEIAAGAGVNRAMISYYFGSKGGLYDAIIDDAVEAAAASLEEARATAPDDDPIRTLVLTFARILAERPHFSRMIIHEYFRPSRLLEPDTAIKLSGFFKLTQATLKSGSLAPEARNYDPQVIHLIIVGALNYFILTDPFRATMQGRLDQPLTRPTIDEFAQSLADLLSRSLGFGVSSQVARTQTVV